MKIRLVLTDLPSLKKLNFIYYYSFAYDRKMFPVSCHDVVSVVVVVLVVRRHLVFRQQLECKYIDFLNCSRTLGLNWGVIVIAVFELLINWGQNKLFFIKYIYLYEILPHMVPYLKRKVGIAFKGHGQNQ